MFENAQELYNFLGILRNKCTDVSWSVVNQSVGQSNNQYVCQSSNWLISQSVVCISKIVFYLSVFLVHTSVVAANYQMCVIIPSKGVRVYIHSCDSFCCMLRSL